MAGMQLHEMTLDELTFELDRAGKHGSWTLEEAIVRLTIHLVSLGENPMTFQYSQRGTVNVSDKINEEVEEMPIPINADEDIPVPIDDVEDVLLSTDTLDTVEGDVGDIVVPTNTDEDIPIDDVEGILVLVDLVDDLLVPLDAETLFPEEMHVLVDSAEDIFIHVDTVEDILGPGQLHDNVDAQEVTKMFTSDDHGEVIKETIYLLLSAEYSRLVWVMVNGKEGPWDSSFFGDANSDSLRQYIWPPDLEWFL